MFWRSIVTRAFSPCVRPFEFERVQHGLESPCHSEGPMDDVESILRYRRTRSGADLDPVIRRHLDWVWSCALRQVRGDEDLAGDIVQAVFLVLMKKPPSPRHAGALAGWLFKVTRYVALNAIRTRGRRRAH